MMAKIPANANKEVKEFCDNYKHYSSNIEYTLECVLCENEGEENEFLKLKENYNTLLLNACHNCDEKQNCSSCHHGSNYILDPFSNELLLNPNKKEYIIYECTSLCSCSPAMCRNRLVQYGPRDKLQVQYSKNYGSLGLFTEEDIPANAFICEYAGELITQSIARDRIISNYKCNQMNYILCLQESPMECFLSNYCTQRSKLMTFIDPTRRGNIGRYLNHSCDPNCSVYSVRIESPIPKIGIISYYA